MKALTMIAGTWDENGGRPSISFGMEAHCFYVVPTPSTDLNFMPGRNQSF